MERVVVERRNLGSLAKLQADPDAGEMVLDIGENLILSVNQDAVSGGEINVFSGDGQHLATIARWGYNVVPHEGMIEFAFEIAIQRARRMFPSLASDWGPVAVVPEEGP